jgi:drug/metabolite transporter (DMT)-like permease
LSTVDALHDHRQRLKGIALMCGALACFSCIDATGKFLNLHMDPLQVVWARYASGFVLALLLSNPVIKPAILVTKRPVLQIFRSALLLLSTILNFIALQYLQLDQALAILFSTPFFVAVLSGPMLGEWVGWRRWIAILVGFLGVVVVARPGPGGIHPAAMLTLAGAFCYAIYIITTRVLARSDSNETTLFYSNLVGAVAMLPVLPFVWTTPQNALLIILMIAIGAFGSFGHYLLIIAHRMAPAAVLAPFIYSQLLWTTILGFLVFADVPNRWTLTGAAIVVASGLYLLYRERVRGRRALSLRND